MRTTLTRTLTTLCTAIALGACGEPIDPTGDGGRPRDGGRDGTSDVGGGDTSVERCAMGVDSDGDMLTNDEECALGSDPFVRDSDMDGVPDGQEARYPRICVHTDRTMQRRPPVACMTMAECAAGEECRGLNPAAADSDMDGVPDGMEDMGLNGMIDPAVGETDPRLWDTDGDGMNDSMGGLEICRPSGLANVTIAPVPMASIQAGHDPAFGTARMHNGTMGRNALVVDDMALNVAGLVVARAATGDVRAEAAMSEAAIMGAPVSGSPVLVGRMLTTHDMNPAVTSTYRVARATSATALRDQIAMALTGAAPMGGVAFGMGSEFFVDVTTTRRTMGGAMGRTDVMVAVTPRADYDNAMRNTAIRANDLVNTTAIAESGSTLDYRCQVFRAEGSSTADFIWTVDTSGSMGPYQMRLGATATSFFTRLQAAGVDFRVGVFNAGVTLPNLDTPGFRFINGTDAMGARRLCEEVTSTGLGTCPTSPSDTLSPYAMPGNSEQPVFAGVLLHDMFTRRAMMGEMNADRRLRAGARTVLFFVTDEPGTNDGRYFRMSNDPMTSMPYGTTYAAALPNIIDYYRRNMILTFGLVSNNGGSGALPAGASPVPCSMLREQDLPRCVIEGNGGAYIPIATATDAEVAAAVARIIDAVAGATSQFRLDRSPITSTIKVRVRGMDVPRSRAQGFDYDPASRSVVFYGTMFRPRMGDQVVISYRTWQGSLG